MRSRCLPFVLACILGAGVVACARGNPGKDVDAAVDAAVAPAPHRRVTVTGGGGSTGSTRYQARIAIGAPQPSGDSAGEAGRVHLGAKPKP
jgi:hypothetical protein